MSAMPTDHDASLRHVFGVFLRLGSSSFGGPVAHLGYFRRELVQRRRWLDDDAFADLVALCQFLPGPSSSQVGMAIGFLRAGTPGALAAWAGFTLPSAVALTLFALWLGGAGLDSRAVWLHGLAVAAAAVVTLAAWQMARRLCPDAPRALLALGATAALIAWPGTATQLGVLAAGAASGLAGTRTPPPAGVPAPSDRRARRRALLCLGAVLALLLGLPLLAAATGAPGWQRLAVFYRAGALVFGGGHVVLPLLEEPLVQGGVIDDARFLAGYGAAQAVPGPLFSVAAYLGAAAATAPRGVTGAAIALVGMFLPSWLLLPGLLPWWLQARRLPWLQRLLPGVNAAVVGLLFAALYDPIGRSALRVPTDLPLLLAAYAALASQRVPAWSVVLACAVAAPLLATFAGTA
jgi:chromate transporter